MTAAKQHDAVRLEAAQAGLPPDVHDPALLASYAALRGGVVDTKVSATEPSAKAKPKARRKR